MKYYHHNDLAGCVQQRIARITGTRVGVYHAEQSGLDNDPEYPWITVCEEHDVLCSHPTLKIAKDHAVDPTGWCHLCQEDKEQRETSQSPRREESDESHPGGRV